MQLYRNEGKFYIRLGDKMTEALGVKDVKHFLRHYSDSGYFAEIEKIAVLDAEACACYEMMAFIDSDQHLCIIYP